MDAVINYLKRNKIVIAFVCILAIGFFLRFYKIESVPKAIHLDETVNGYVGRFILSNGVDLYGNRFPLLYFDKFGDYPPVIPMYIQSLGTYLFGFTELGSRFITALLGCLLLIPVFFIAKMLFKDKRTALFTMFLTAIIPWQIVFSRTSAEGIMASFFYLIGLTFLFSFWKKNDIKLFFYSLPFFLFTFFLYPPFRIITSLTFLPLPLFFFFKKDIKKTALSIFVVMSFFSLLLFIVMSPWGRGRVDQISIFNIVSGVDIKNKYWIYNDKTPPLLTRIFHNKPVGYTREFLKQFFSYYTGMFLFTDGGGEITHQVPNSGEMYLTVLPLFLLPLFLYFKKKNLNNIDGKLFYYIIYLSLIASIPAALTVVAVPNPHRSILTGIFLCFIAAYGFNTILDLKIKRIPVTYFVYVFLMLEVVGFVHNYVAHVDLLQFIGTNEGAKEAVLYVKKEQNKYKDIYITGSNYMAIYYLYFAGDVSRELAGKFKIKLILENYKNLHFFDTDCAVDKISENRSKIKEKVLIINRGKCVLPEGVSKVAEFKAAFGNAAFSANVYNP
jgi:4-amino-4-deoxy-L-arabinose transferase-like glycosyltransferase